MLSRFSSRMIFALAAVIIFLGGAAIAVNRLSKEGGAESLPVSSPSDDGALTVAASPADDQARESAAVQTFHIFRYNDPQAGMEAFRLLLPQGWQAEGAVTWSLNPALPAQSRFRFFDPGGSAEFDIFPTQAYFWTDNQMFLGTNPPGTLRFGTLVAAPVDMRTAFFEIIIPVFRSHVSGLQILEEAEVPELAELATGVPTEGVRATAQGGKIRITYDEGGMLMEEEIYAAVSQFVIPIPGSAFSGGYYINYWYIDYIFSFKAEKGKLDRQSRTFQTMAHSLEVNPGYFAKVANVREALAQKVIRGIRIVGRIGDMIAQSGSDIRADQQEAWEQRQEVQERIARNFSDYTRGVERFNDPFAGKEVELPSGYGHAWANNLGEYIVTDSPSYNPNVGSNLSWEPLSAAE